jgi:serine/threonine protein kinase
MSPEITTGQPYTEKADIFALGMIGCELATGATPATLGITSSYYTATRLPSPESQKRWAELPQGLRDIIVRALSEVSN